jgi:hypothetical protein
VPDVPTIVNIADELTAVPTGATILAAPASAAFELAHVLTADHPVLETHLVFPAGDRWSVSELSENVLRPSQLTTPVRRVIVVGAADAMTAATADKALKTWEEPLSDTVFVLASEHPEKLPTTVRGRAHVTWAPESTAPEQLAATLVARGATVDLAAAAVTMTSDFVLADAASRTAEAAAELQAALDTPLQSATPTAAAHFCVAHLAALAASYPVKERPVVIRAGVRRVLDGWHAAVAESLRTGIPDADRLEAAEQLVAVLRRARLALDVFVDPVLVVASVLVTTPVPRPVS